MDPADVDRRFAELVTAEFGEQAWGEQRDAPQERGGRGQPQAGPPDQVPPGAAGHPVADDPVADDPVPDDPVAVPSADDPVVDDVDYRTPSASAPLPADVRIAVILSAAGLVGLLVAGFVVNLPANLVWLGPAAAGGGLVWLLVRAMRRPPRDPDDGSGAVL